MSSTYVFDAYGTLFDVHAAMARFQTGPDAQRMSEIWRTKQLEYTWTLTLAGHYADFWTLTEQALDHALARVPSVDKGLKPQLLDAYFKLDAYPDARAALEALKAKGHKTGILSNGSPEMLKGAVDGGRPRRRSRRRALGRRAEDVQAAARGLSARHRPLQMRRQGCHVRIIEPLGRDGRHLGRLPYAVGQPQRHAGRISRFRPRAEAFRSERAGRCGLTATPGRNANGRGGEAAIPRLYAASPYPFAAGSMPPIISIKNLSKTYATGFQALNDINLDINRGEIFALLGPNGAGKTTLIGITCGIVNASAGTVTVDGHDIVKDYRATRSLIGLVPQEITMAPFDTVWAAVSMTRGLFNKPKNPAYLEKVLKDLSLWDKRDSKIVALSGGMKRRVLIAKALSHEPQILFLDEPTAGVDVELRQDMWEVVRQLRASGVTIILTTHYIEEAEEMADRVGVINKGEIVLVEDKTQLMRKLGRKQLVLQLQKTLETLPEELAGHNLKLADGGSELVFTYDTRVERTGITALLNDLNRAGIRFRDLHTTQSSLEDIFVGLVRGRT